MITVIKELDDRNPRDLSEVVRKINEFIRDYNKRVGVEHGS